MKRNLLVMRKTIIITLLLLTTAVISVLAVKITLFENLDLYMKRGQAIVIADFVSTTKALHGDGLYVAEVNVTRVLKGQTKLGKLDVLTIYPMTPGTSYLLYSLADPPEFQAIPELSVVPLPSRFNLSELDKKSLKEQLLLVFEPRLFYVKQELQQREQEKQQLERAMKGFAQ